MTKRIAIDCRKFHDFGIGTTIRGIVDGLDSIDTGDLEFLILGPSSIRDRIPPSSRFTFAEETSPHYSIRELRAVGRTAESSGADLLHVPHYVTPRTSLPIVTTIHDLIHLRVPRHDLPFGGRLYARWMLGRAARKSARIVTVSNAVRREIEGRFERAIGKVAVVPNGVAPVEAPAAPLAERTPLLLFVGNDKPHKNVDRLVEAFSKVGKEHPDWTLVLVGSPFERFRDLEGIDVRGFVPEDELIELYRGATALVQPSLMEGFGLPVLEAMAHGTPVIVSAIPSLLEVAGDAAIPIDEPERIDSITVAISNALRHSSVLQHSSELGPSIAARYTWKNAAESLLVIWRDVLDRTR